MKHWTPDQEAQLQRLMQAKEQAASLMRTEVNEVARAIIETHGYAGDDGSGVAAAHLPAALLAHADALVAVLAGDADAPRPYRTHRNARGYPKYVYRQSKNNYGWQMRIDGKQAKKTGYKTAEEAGAAAAEIRRSNPVTIGRPVLRAA